MNSAHVLSINIADDIGLTIVLTQRSDGNTVTSITIEVLDVDLGRVGFETDTIVSVDDDRVSDDDIGRTVSVPYEQSRRTIKTKIGSSKSRWETYNRQCSLLGQIHSHSMT